MATLNSTTTPNLWTAALHPANPQRGYVRGAFLGLPVIVGAAGLGMAFSRDWVVQIVFWIPVGAAVISAMVFWFFAALQGRATLYLANHNLLAEWTIPYGAWREHATKEWRSFSRENLIGVGMLALSLTGLGVYLLATAADLLVMLLLLMIFGYVAIIWIAGYWEQARNQKCVLASREDVTVAISANAITVANRVIPLQGIGFRVSRVDIEEENDTGLARLAFVMEKRTEHGIWIPHTTQRFPIPSGREAEAATVAAHFTR